MEITEFLKKLEIVSKSAYALVAYVLLICAWVVIIWIKNNPKRKVLQILKLYKKDSDRNTALKNLLGGDPPNKLDKKNVLEWIKISSKDKQRKLFLIGYIATLITILLIVTITLIKSNNDKGEIELIETRSKRL
ncbi:MAG TPA: hypothetical protein VIH57_25445 [Bacteroidales bacterium]